MHTHTRRAFELGQIAAKRGDSRIPALNHDLMGYIESLSYANAPDLMQAFVEGYADELAREIEMLRALAR